MENEPNVSSEEELQKLHDEGKISEEEYQELSEAMGRRSKVEARPIEQAKPSAGSKRALGVAAFLIMLAGIALPVLSLGVVLMAGLPRYIVILTFLGSLAVLITALVLGIIAWRSGWGKATVICALVCPFVLVLPVGFCLFVGIRRTAVPVVTTAIRQEQHRNAVPVVTAVIRQEQLSSVICTQLSSSISKWKNAAVSSSSRYEHLRSTYLVIDTTKKTVRIVGREDGLERAPVVELIDYCDWQLYRITPDSKSLLRGEVRLKPATTSGKRNICKEAFVLIGKSGRNRGAWLEIRPGHTGSGSGLPALDSFEFPEYKYLPGPDAIDESMLVADDEQATTMPGP